MAGDFSGDGRLDLAVADSTYFAPGTVSILLGNGDGTFQPADHLPGRWRRQLRSWRATSTATAGSTWPSAAAPIFHRGRRVSVLLGNGDGTFQPAVTYAIGISSTRRRWWRATSMATAELDLADRRLLDDDISVLLSNGDGTLLAAGQFATTPHGQPAGGRRQRRRHRRRPGRGWRGRYPLPPGHPRPARHLRAARRRSTPAIPSRDIAWVPEHRWTGRCWPASTPRTMRSRSMPIATAASSAVGSLATGQLPAQIIAADLNGSGWDDLVVRNAGDGTLSVFFNNRARQLRGRSSTTPSCRR